MIYSKEAARLNLISAVRLIGKVFSTKASRRDGYERRFMNALEKLYSDQRKKILLALGDPPSMDNVPPWFWDEMSRAELGVVIPLLEEIALSEAENLITGLPIGVDWALINQNAIDWASDYAFDLVKGIDEASRAALGSAVSDYFERGLTIGDLENNLSGIFGSVRAEMIAVTEVTRASVEGERLISDSLKQEGIEMVEVWQTNEDELVCDICGPLNGRALGDGWEREDGPPAHPRCRCWVNHQLPGAVE